MSKETILSRLQRIDRRILYWILFAFLLIPFIRPLNLPITITDQTISFYEELKKFKEGDTVLIGINMGVSAWPECLPGLVASTKQVVRQKSNLVYITTSVDGSITYDKIVEQTPELKAYKYGEKYVFLGYTPATDASISQLAKDIRAIFKTDYKGTPMDQLPLMKNVNKAQDFRAVISSDAGDVGEYYIRHWRIPLGTPVAEIGIAMVQTVYQPWWMGGTLFGLLTGVRGGAELEKLIGSLGEATVTMDAINSSHLILVIAILLANVGYLAGRGRK